MFLKENEAKTKTCPNLTSTVQYTDTYNQRQSYVRIVYCFGSGCMAWRWFDDPETEAEPRGFCGVAGSIYGTVK